MIIIMPKYHRANRVKGRNTFVSASLVAWSCAWAILVHCRKEICIFNSWAESINFMTTINFILSLLPSLLDRGFHKRGIHGGDN